VLCAAQQFLGAVSSGPLLGQPPPPLPCRTWFSAPQPPLAPIVVDTLASLTVAPVHERGRGSRL